MDRENKVFNNRGDDEMRKEDPIAPSIQQLCPHPISTFVHLALCP